MNVEIKYLKIQKIITKFIKKKNFLNQKKILKSTEKKIPKSGRILNSKEKLMQKKKYLKIQKKITKSTKKEFSNLEGNYKINRKGI